MNLVFLMRFWPVYGGGETVTRTLANEMAARGYQVSVIYLWDRSNDTDTFIDPRVNCIKLHNITNINDGGIKKSEFPLIQKQLKLIFKALRPDTVINQWLPNKEVSKALKGLGSSLIKCHHGVIKYVPVIKTFKQKAFYTILGDRGGWIRVYWELKKDLVYSDLWIFLSQASRRDACKLFPWADRKKLGVIPNPLPYKIMPGEISLADKKKEVIYVGRMIELKRVHYLLDAWKMIEDTVPGWIFRLIGDGVTLPDEKEYAERLGLKHVIFEGFKDAKDYVKNGSILLMASSQEGFSLVLVEAQQCGCVPVAVESFPAVHDIIESGKNGVLVENNNIKAYAESVYELIVDENKRNKMAENALEDSKKFSLDCVCDQWEALLKTLEKEKNNG